MTSPTLLGGNDCDVVTELHNFRGECEWWGGKVHIWHNTWASVLSPRNSVHLWYSLRDQAEYQRTLNVVSQQQCVWPDDNKILCPCLNFCEVHVCSLYQLRTCGNTAEPVRNSRTRFDVLASIAMRAEKKQKAVPLCHCGCLLTIRVGNFLDSLLRCILKKGAKSSKWFRLHEIFGSLPPIAGQDVTPPPLTLFPPPWHVTSLTCHPLTCRPYRCHPTPIGLVIPPPRFGGTE